MENDLAYKKSVNVSEKKGLELEYTIQEKRLAQLRRKLRETRVRAPQSGVITWINKDLGRKVNEGQPLVRIANLDKFRVEATSSDRYASSLKIGLPVRVRINGQDLTGNIETILPAVENNTLKFVVALDQPDADVLRPNLRTEVYIITGRKTNVLRVKNGAAFKGASTQYVFVVKGDQAIKRRIRKGLSNSDYVEILSDLSEGERVIISETEDYKNLDQFTIISE